MTAPTKQKKEDFKMEFLDIFKLWKIMTGLSIKGVKPDIRFKVYELIEYLYGFIKIQKAADQKICESYTNWGCEKNMDGNYDPKSMLSNIYLDEKLDGDEKEEKANLNLKKMFANGEKYKELMKNLGEANHVEHIFLAENLNFIPSDQFIELVKPEKREGVINNQGGHIAQKVTLTNSLEGGEEAFLYKYLVKKSK